MAGKSLLSAPLGQLPRGLLDFFSIKSMGEYPQRLGNEVVPTMELFRWYADQAANTGVAVFSALGTLSPFTANIGTLDWTSGTGAFDFARGAGNTVVPQNELWIVLEAATRWTITDVGGSCDAALVAGQSTSDSATQFVITDGPLEGFTTGLGGISRMGQRAATRPVILLPGMELVSRGYGQGAGAGTITIAHSVRIRRVLA